MAPSDVSAATVHWSARVLEQGARETHDEIHVVSQWCHTFPRRTT